MGVIDDDAGAQAPLERSESVGDAMTRRTSRKLSRQLKAAAAARGLSVGELVRMLLALALEMLTNGNITIHRED